MWGSPHKLLPSGHTVRRRYMKGWERGCRASDDNRQEEVSKRWPGTGIGSRYDKVARLLDVGQSPTLSITSATTNHEEYFPRH